MPRLRSETRPPTRSARGSFRPIRPATFTISDSTVVGFPSTDVPVQISDDGNTYQSTLAIDKDMTIHDLNVQLNISFPYDGDLAIYLESPNQTFVTLYAFEPVPDGD